MRILFYSPDSYGLGHVRRSSSLAAAALARIPSSSALLLTGAPDADCLSYARGCAAVKLPAVSKNEEGRYVSRDLDAPFENTIRRRREMIRETAAAYRPDVLLVDHSPLGLGNEILPTLEQLGRAHRHSHRILGLRDIIDEPAAVKRAWAKDGAIEVMRRHYDEVLVYGQQDVFDPIREYDIPADVAAKMRFVGYIPRVGSANFGPVLHRRYAPRTGRLVLVTLGGGGDGAFVLQNLCDGFRRLGKSADFEVVAVTGPLMSQATRDHYLAQAEQIPGLTVLESSPYIPELIGAADYVVSMGGYNTTCELASAGARALIVPRTFPRKEQLVRASLLAERGVVDCLPPAEATPDALIRTIRQGLERPRPARGWGLQFTGLENTAAVLETQAEVERLRRACFAA